MTAEKPSRKNVMANLFAHKGRVNILSAVVSNFSLITKVYKNDVYYLPTILLKDLTLKKQDCDPMEADHAWIKANDVIMEDVKDLKIGMKISFDASICKYKKTDKQKLDYGLTGIDEIEVLNDNIEGKSMYEFLKELYNKNKKLYIDFDFFFREKKLEEEEVVQS